MGTTFPTPAPSPTPDDDVASLWLDRDDSLSNIFKFHVTGELNPGIVNEEVNFCHIWPTVGRRGSNQHVEPDGF